MHEKSLGVVKSQTFNWGNMAWLCEPSDPSRERLSAAVATFNPGAVQPLHYHSGDEHVMYVLSGYGESLCDGRPEKLSPGIAIHMPARAYHEVRNTGSEPLRLLLVYSPSNFVDVMSQLLPPDQQLDDPAAEGRMIRGQTARSLQERAAGILGFGVAVLDPSGNPVFPPSRLPESCCGPEGVDLACRKKFRQLETIASAEIISCCSGTVCLSVPVVYRGKVLGHIEAGPVYLSDPAGSGTRKPGVPVVPKSRLYAAGEFLRNMADLMIQAAAFQTRQDMLMRRKLSTLARLADVSPSSVSEAIPKAGAIERAEAFIKENFSHPIRLEDVAKLVYLSPTYFSRLFKKETGFTFPQYLNQLRIARAKNLLLSTGRSAKEIAAEVGYQDASYFAQVFKEAEGCTPLDFRERQKSRS